MALYAGIDCGTQGTKVVIVDSTQGVILGEGNAPHRLISQANGRREQEADWWIEALVIAFRQAVTHAGIDAREIHALGVSGQQHGFVPLDADGNVLHSVKLWCDTETAEENERLLQQLGGANGSLETLGLRIATGYTASKILWFKAHHPALWAQLHTVLLPHDYLNFWLTGERVAEYGDASGTGLFDVRTRRWSKTAVDLIDDSGRLWQALPPLKSAECCIGTVRPAAAEKLGLGPAVRVSTGGGDNMMAAIGSGNIEAGTLTLSLGTSGTLFGNGSWRFAEYLHTIRSRSLIESIQVMGAANPALLRQAIKIAEVILDVGIEAHPFRKISSSFWPKEPTRILNIATPQSPSP